MNTLSANKLFTPIQVGAMELKHRVVMAPLTRAGGRVSETLMVTSKAPARRRCERKVTR